MRVTIEHREETSGLVKNHKDCYVDCTVDFSQEERAIIKERDLYREGFDIRTSTPMPTTTDFFSSAGLRIIGRILMVAGFIFGVLSSNWGGLFFVGLGLEIYGWLRGRKQDNRLENSEQTITVKQLLSKPTFTVHAWNAGYAKAIEENIRDKLALLKGVIQSSAQLNAKQTFEL